MPSLDIEDVWLAVVIVLIALKVAAVITIGWWLVLLPIWLPAIGYFVLLGLAGIFEGW